MPQRPWEKYQAQSGPWVKYQADPNASIKAQQAAKYPSQQELGRPVEPQQTVGSFLRESALGLAEYGGIDPEAPVTGTLKNLAGAPAAIARDVYENPSEYLLLPKLMRKIGDAALEAPKEAIAGLREGDYDKMAHGVGGTLGVAAGIASGTKSGQQVLRGAATRADDAVQAAKAGTADALRRSAAKTYERILAPTTKESKFRTGRVAPEMASRGVAALTEKRLAAKVKASKDAALDSLERAWAKIPENEAVDTRTLVDAIETAKKKFIVDNVTILPAAVDKLDELTEIIKQFGDSVSPRTLRKTRQVWDMIVDQAGGFGGKDLAATSQSFAQKQVANVIRSTIADRFPNVKRLNAEFSFWANVDDVLEAKGLRETGRNLTLRDLISGSAGSGLGVVSGGVLGGSVGAAAGPLLMRLFQSTGSRTALARLKLKVANLIDKGRFDEAAQIITDPSRLLPERTSIDLGPSNTSAVTGSPAAVEPANRAIRTGRLLPPGKPLPPGTEPPSGGFTMEVQTGQPLIPTDPYAAVPGAKTVRPRRVPFDIKFDPATGIPIVVEVDPLTGLPVRRKP